jgi:hypothetical protein
MSDTVKTSTEVIIDTPVPYAGEEGKQIQCTCIHLYAPSAKQLENVTPMKQLFFQAVGSLKDDDKAKDKPPSQEKVEMSASDVMSMMFMSEVDMTKFMNHAKALFISGMIKLDGKKDFNEGLIEKLSADDFEKVVGEYLVNFIIASALKKLNSSGS